LDQIIYFLATEKNFSDFTAPDEYINVALNSQNKKEKRPRTVKALSPL
jgi:hypothetical protein